MSNYRRAASRPMGAAETNTVPRQTSTFRNLATGDFNGLSYERIGRQTLERQQNLLIAKIFPAFALPGALTEPMRPRPGFSPAFQEAQLIQSADLVAANNPNAYPLGVTWDLPPLQTGGDPGAEVVSGWITARVAARQHNPIADYGGETGNPTLDLILSPAPRTASNTPFWVMRAFPLLATSRMEWESVLYATGFDGLGAVDAWDAVVPSLECWVRMFVQSTEPGVDEVSVRPEVSADGVTWVMGAEATLPFIPAEIGIGHVMGLSPFQVSGLAHIETYGAAAPPAGVDFAPGLNPQPGARSFR